MPSHIPSRLKLDPPVFEEDISDLSPYLALPSTSSRASSSSVTISSSTSSPGFTTTDDEIDYPSPSGTPRKQSFSFPTPSRSEGLLPVQEDSLHRPLRKEIDMDLISVAKIRRWILGIAVGESAHFPRVRSVTRCHS